VLGILALVGGAIHLPLGDALPIHAEHHPPVFTEILAIGLPLLGLLIGYLFYGKQLWPAAAISQSRLGKPLARFFYSGWGMDWLYDLVLVQPYKTLAKVNQKDIVDWLSKGAVIMSRGSYGLLSFTQNGQLRYYVATMATASIVIIFLSVWW